MHPAHNKEAKKFFLTVYKNNFLHIYHSDPKVVIFIYFLPINSFL